MKKIILFYIIFSVSCLAIVNSSHVYAEEAPGYAVDLMLAGAEDFFTSLKKGRYDTAWHLISDKSRKTIIDDVFKRYQEMGGAIQREAIEQDFENSGLIFRNYWSAFVQSFDILMVLDDSRWQAGVIQHNKADIIITYKNSTNPLKLQMIKENDVWKVGLVETFWNSRTMDILQSILKFI